MFALPFSAKSGSAGQPAGSASPRRLALWGVQGALLGAFGALHLLLAAEAGAWQLQALPEFYRPDPFGGLVAVDQVPGKPVPDLLAGPDGTVTLTSPRNAYVSCHLVVSDPAGGRFEVAVDAAPGVEVDLFREWFHRNSEDGKYYPDALVPIGKGEVLVLPDPEMKIEGQKAVAIWIDVWISGKATPGSSQLRLELSTGGAPVVLPIKLHILDAVLPDEDAITADHNCYGVGWVSVFFPERAKSVTSEGRNFTGSNEFFKAIHEAHRFYYEHRGSFHQLGTSHTGSVSSHFAPELTGAGRTKRVKSWEVFDRHFGPLLDGSAMAGTRRAPRPIDSVYLTITPDWPASYLWWGQRGYETEFVRVVSQMEQHFRQKGWTHTDFEMFFNHKKRYRSFCWDGDETRFEKDNMFFREFGRLLHKAVPPDSPVRFVFRHDASWLMWNQFHELAGLVDFWVCGSGIFAFYPEAPALLKARGDKVWIYGSAASAFETTASILELPLKTWMFGIDGYILWLVTNPGSDPWFGFEGGKTCMMFPGEPFGVDGPIPSLRLKIQRNFLQDLALLDVVAARKGEDGKQLVRTKVASLAGGLKPADWWNPDAPVKKLPPYEWSNSMLREAAKEPVHQRQKLDGRWWLAVREYALKAVQEVSQ